MQASLISPWMGLFVISLAAVLASGAILLVLLKTGLAWRLATDVPNDRSLHVRPTPRVGGWSIVPVTVAALLALAPSLWCITLGTILLAAVSQVDDRRGLPARVRFAAHFIAVVALVVLFPANVPWWALCVIAFLMLWLVNLYNFMDGADGLAGGMAMFGFAAYAVAALSGAHPLHELAWGAGAIVGAAIGFLLFNFHPARIFLGDAGSISLGFLAGALGYWGWRAEVWPIWFPAMVFAPFIVDASITLMRRMARGDKFWQPHREHYYQRMVRSGLGHAYTAIIWYLIMALGSILAVWALGRSPLLQWITAAGWIVCLLLLACVVDIRWRRFHSVLGERSEVTR